MKNKFFINKFLPILSVFLFTIFVFFTNVKATSDTKTIFYNDKYYNLPTECTDNFIFLEYDGKLHLIFGDTPYWGLTVRRWFSL